MSEPHGKDEHSEMLSEHARAVEQWFSQTIADMDKKSVFAPPKQGVRYRCPCCRSKTLEERGGYDICPVCFWEDDGQDDEDADTNRVFSPNQMSLTQARENYRLFGACQERLIQYVRPPLPEEL